MAVRRPSSSTRARKEPTEQRRQLKRWAFTVHERADEGLWLDEALRLAFIETLNLHSSKWVFQLEKCPTTGNMHYQGRISLKTAARAGELSKRINPFLPTDIRHPLFVVHMTPEHDTMAGDFYCTKEASREAGPWDNKPAQYVPKRLRGILWKPWQLELKDLVVKQTDREILFVLDEIGGAGKSHFVNWHQVHEKCLVIPAFFERPHEMMQSVHGVWKASGLKPSDTATIFLDIPRATKHNWHTWLATVEYIKSGNLYDARYKMDTQLIEPPRVVIFVNSLPPPDLLTADRIKIFKVPADAPNQTASQSDPNYTGPPPEKDQLPAFVLAPPNADIMYVENPETAEDQAEDFFDPNFDPLEHDALEDLLRDDYGSQDGFLGDFNKWALPDSGQESAPLSHDSQEDMFHSWHDADGSLHMEMV